MKQLVDEATSNDSTGPWCELLWEEKRCWVVCYQPCNLEVTIADALGRRRVRRFKTRESAHTEAERLNGLERAALAREAAPDVEGLTMGDAPP